MSDTTMLRLPDDDPRVRAFKIYIATSEYLNTFKWAAQEEHRKGSLWAAFNAGWMAAALAIPAASGEEGA